MNSERDYETLRAALIVARAALHRACLERGSTDGYGDDFQAINEALLHAR